MIYVYKFHTKFPDRQSFECKAQFPLKQETQMEVKMVEYNFTYTFLCILLEIKTQ